MTHDAVPPGSSVERYREYLLVLARVQMSPLLKGKVDPSDLVQETLLKAHENRGQFRGATEAELTGWLRRILTNTMIDACRRFGAEGRDVGREVSLAAVEESSARLEALLANSAASPPQQMMHQEQLLRLATALGQLPPDQRSAVELHHLQAYTIEEIAKEMERTKDAVGGLLRRGMSRLRQLLDESS